MTTTGSTAQALDSTWNAGAVSSRSPAQQLVLTSFEKSALTMEEYAELVINFANTHEERTRRAFTHRRVQLLRDAWGPLLKASFENWTTPAVADAVIGPAGDHLDISANPAKQIWRETAVTYKTPPRRDTPKKKSAIKQYNKLLEGTSFELHWQLAEPLLEACNEVLIWPEFVTIDGETKLKHCMAAGNVFTLVANEEHPTEIEAVLFIDEFNTLAGVRKVVYRLWTKEWHAQFEADPQGGFMRTGRVNEALASDNPELDNSAPNPFGRIPFHLVRSNPWCDQLLDITTGEDLVDLTLRGAEHRLFYRYLQKMGGFKQGVATGEAIESKMQQLLDPGVLLKIEGTQVNFQLIDWSVDLKAMLDCMMADELRAAAGRGINPERFKRTGNNQGVSGARVAERGLAENRLRRVPIWTLAEQAYYDLVALRGAKQSIEGAPPEDTELKVFFAPLAYPEDPKEQLEVEKAELSMGLVSPMQLLQRRNPELTDDDAMKIIQSNMEAIALVNDMKVKHNIPNDPTKESASAEQNGLQGPAVRDAQILQAQNLPSDGPGTPKPERNSD